MKASEAIKVLKSEGIGILPTDTLYGIVGQAFSKRAVERIYEVKGRNETKPFIILISSIKDLEKFRISSKLQKVFIENSTGRRPISIILPLPKSVQKKYEYLHRKTNSIAFRFPKKKSLIQILKKTGPLVAPSANPEGFPPATTITEAKKHFGNKIDFYIGGGRKIGKPSKLISISPDGQISIIRS